MTRTGMHDGQEGNNLGNSRSSATELVHWQQQPHRVICCQMLCVCQVTLMT